MYDAFTFDLNRRTFLIAGAQLWEPSAPSFQLQKFVLDLEVLIKSSGDIERNLYFISCLI